MQVDAGSGNGSGGGIDVFNTSGTGLDRQPDDRHRRLDDQRERDQPVRAGAGCGHRRLRWQLARSPTRRSAGTPRRQERQSTAVARSSPTPPSSARHGHSTPSPATRPAAQVSGGNLDVQSGSTLNLGESIVAGACRAAPRRTASVGGGSLHSVGYNLIDDTSCGTPGRGRHRRPEPAARSSGEQRRADNDPAPGLHQPRRERRAGVRHLGHRSRPPISGVTPGGRGSTAPPPSAPSKWHRQRPRHRRRRPQRHPTATHGYWLVGSDGGIFTFGSAQFLRVDRRHHAAATGRRHQPDSQQGRLLARRAPTAASSPSATPATTGRSPASAWRPRGPASRTASTPRSSASVPSSDGGGYFMVASDGGVFAFGDARFAGSCPGDRWLRGRRCGGRAGRLGQRVLADHPDRQRLRLRRRALLRRSGEPGLLR